MAPGGPDLRCVTPRASAPLVTQGAMSTPDLATSVARGVAAAATEILERFTRPPQVDEADCPPVDLAANATIRERFPKMQSRHSTVCINRTDHLWSDICIRLAGSPDPGLPRRPVDAPA